MLHVGLSLMSEVVNSSSPNQGFKVKNVIWVDKSMCRVVAANSCAS